MSRENLEYYDFNLKFLVHELREISPKEAQRLAAHADRCVDAAVSSLHSEGPEAAQAFAAALKEYRSVKRIVSPLLPGWFDDSQRDELTEGDRSAFNNGFRELGEFIRQHPQERYRQGSIP